MGSVWESCNYEQDIQQAK